VDNCNGYVPSVIGLFVIGLLSNWNVDLAGRLPVAPQGARPWQSWWASN
jgi:hypothetical protein